MWRRPTRRVFEITGAQRARAPALDSSLLPVAVYPRDVGKPLKPIVKGDDLSGREMARRVPPLDRGLAVWRRLSVAPMSRRHAEAAHPMHVEAALSAVENELLELTFEIGLHLQELRAEHLGVGDEWIGPPVPDPNRLVDEVVSLRCLLGDGVDGVLEDLALPPRHGGMVAEAPDCLSLRLTVPTRFRRTRPDCPEREHLTRHRQGCGPARTGS